MRQYLAFPGSIVLVAGQPWKGAIWGRDGDHGSTLDAVLVSPRERRQKVATKLVKELSRRLNLRSPLRFGGGSHHFVPGLPQQFASFQNFFTSIGFVADWQAYDLLWRSSHHTTTSSPCLLPPDRYRLIDLEHSEKLTALLTHFGKRWQDDTKLRIEANREGCKEEVMGAFLEGELVGFCHLWTRSSKRLGPSTFWLERTDNLWGGIGPIGIHPTQRGQGLGLGIVQASIDYLKGSGITKVGVDWTGIPGFYKACGFRPWISYQGYHQEQ